MKSMLSFISLIAVGLMAASAVAIIGFGFMPNGGGLRPSTPVLDYRSLSIGLVIGLSLSWFARVHWAELPRRVLTWLWTNERNFYRGALALLLLGIVIFY